MGVNFYRLLNTRSLSRVRNVKKDTSFVDLEFDSCRCTRHRETISRINLVWTCNP